MTVPITCILSPVVTQGQWLLPSCDSAFFSALRILLVQQADEKRECMAVVVGLEGQAW